MKVEGEAGAWRTSRISFGGFWYLTSAIRLRQQAMVAAMANSVRRIVTPLSTPGLY
jgi:hypothetical protein